MKIGGKYNWINQPERLVYIGKQGAWHQFAKVDKPDVIWCEVLTDDLSMIEETRIDSHVEIIEIGTPCIKHNGIKLLETLRAKFPNNKILVDLKTFDASFYEGEPLIEPYSFSGGKKNGKRKRNPDRWR